MEFLIDASNSGHTSEVIEVERSDNRGLTPLNCLAIRGDMQMFKTLVHKGRADVERSSPKGCTPLLYAARGGYVEIVQYLLKEVKANWMATDHSGGSVVHHAVQKRQLEVLMALHGHGVDFNLRDLAHRSPIFEAIENDDGSQASRNTISLLLDSGALLDVTDCQGHTPLYSAVRSGNESLAHFLLDEGDANPNLYATNAEQAGEEASESTTSLDHFASGPNSEYEKRLVDGLGNAATPLQIASLLGMDDLVQHLLKAGADPNLAANSGKEYPPLVFCMLGNKLDTAMLLLRHGASPYCPDAEGKTLMDWLALIDPMQKLDILDLIGDLKNEGVITNELPNPQASVILEEEEDLESDEEERYRKQDTGLPEDDREIKGISGDTKHIFETAEISPEKTGETVRFQDIKDLSKLVIEPGREKHPLVAEIFGDKVALAVICNNQQYRELGVRQVLESYKAKMGGEDEMGLGGVVLKACAFVLNETLGDRVLKVFNAALQLFSGIVSSSKIEEEGIEVFAEIMTECDLITKIVQKAEESARQMAKAKQALLDVCFHPKIGAGYVASFLNSRIAYHNKFDPASMDNEKVDPTAPSHSSQNVNGLQRCLAILFEMVQKFKLAKSGPLSTTPLLDLIGPALQHVHSKPVREMALKILVEIHKKTNGGITASKLEKMGIVAPYFNQIKSKLAKVKGGAAQPARKMDDFMLSQEDDDDQEEERSSTMPRSNELIKVATGQEEEQLAQRAQELKRKDWTEREMAIRRVRDDFQAISEGSGGSDLAALRSQFDVVVSTLDMKNLSLYLIAVEAAKLFFAFVFDRKLAACTSLQALAHSLSLIVPRTGDSNTRVKKKSVEAVMTLWKKSALHMDHAELTAAVAGLVLDKDRHYKERGLEGRLSLLNYKLTEILEQSARSKAEDVFLRLFGCNVQDVLKFVNKYSQNHRNAKVRERASLAIVQLAQFACKTQSEQGKNQILSMLVTLKPAARDAILTRIQELCEGLFTTQDIARLQSKKKTAASSPSKNQEQDQKGEEAQQDGKLPYAQEMKPETRKKSKEYIEAFGEQVVRCFYAAAWSCRAAALSFLKQNIPRMLLGGKKAASYRALFSTFCKFVNEGLKDVVLKVFATAVELIETALPHFFREVQGSLLKTSLEPVIATLFSKTKDMRPKCHEAAVSCMGFLAHQSPIGPQYMCEYVLKQLEESQRSTGREAAASLDKAISNASFWTSALKLLAQFERVAQLCAQTGVKGKNAKSAPYIETFMKYTNLGLAHTSTGVRAAAIDLYITLFEERGREIEMLLARDLKPAMRSKLEQATHHAKREQANDLEASTSQSLSMAARGDIYKHSLNYFKSGDAKRRMKGLIYVKKQFTIDSSSLQLGDDERARDLWESLTLVLRSLLSDTDIEIYLQSLKLLQQGLQKLVSHLNTFDLMISMGSFLSTLISKTTSTNMRMQMASDKMLLGIAKTPEIGPALIVRDLAASLEKNARSGGQMKPPVLADGQCNKMVSMVNSLVTQFPGDGKEFVLKGTEDLCGQTLSALGATLLAYPDSQLLRTQTTQIITALYSRGLHEMVQRCLHKIDLQKRTPLNKIIMQLKPAESEQTPTSAQGLRSSSGFRDGVRNDERESESRVSTARKTRTNFELPRGNTGGPSGTLEELRSTTNSFFGGPVMVSPHEKAEVPEEQIQGMAPGPFDVNKNKQPSISQMRRSQSEFRCIYPDSFKGYDPSEGRRGIPPAGPPPPAPPVAPAALKREEQPSSLLERLPDIHKKNTSFLPPINSKGIGGGRGPPPRVQKTDPFSSYTHSGLSGGSRGYDPMLMDKIPGLDPVPEDNPSGPKLSISQQRRNQQKPPLFNVGGPMNPLPEVEELSYSTSSMNVKSPHAIQQDILNEEVERADSRIEQMRKSSQRFNAPLSLDDILGYKK